MKELKTTEKALRTGRFEIQLGNGGTLWLINLMAAQVFFFAPTHPPAAAPLKAWWCYFSAGSCVIGADQSPAKFSSWPQSSMQRGIVAGSTSVAHYVFQTTVICRGGCTALEEIQKKSVELHWQVTCRPQAQGNNYLHPVSTRCEDGAHFSPTRGGVGWVDGHFWCSFMFDIFLCLHWGQYDSSAQPGWVAGHVSLQKCWTSISAM